MIHKMDEGEADFGSVLYLNHRLIKRGWAWKMSATYQLPARRWIDCEILEDVQPERSTMKPRIQITTCYGFVTKVKSEGTEIEVEVIEEDTGKEVLYTSQSSADGDILFAAENVNAFWLVTEH